MCIVNWDAIWKIEKYPMWVENGKIEDYWDKNAAKRFKRISKNRVATENQLKMLNLKKTDTVLDIGCGTGRLAIPIAKKVRKVYALDASREMIKIVKKCVEGEKLNNVQAINTNWESFDINSIEKVDVTISYNSLGVYEIRKALEKSNEITKRDIYIFTFAGKGEWLDDALAKIVYGKNIELRHSSALIIYNLLFQMGISADIEIKNNYWHSEHETIDDAVLYIMQFYKLSDELEKKVREFVIKRIKKENDKYTLLQNRKIAKIYWRVDNG